MHAWIQERYGYTNDTTESSTALPEVLILEHEVLDDVLCVDITIQRAQHDVNVEESLYAVSHLDRMITMLDTV